MKKTTAIKKIFIINTGILTNSKEFDIKSYNESTVPVFSYLIQHEKEWVLFDTGLSPLLAENPQSYLGNILDSFIPFRTRKDWILSSQLPIPTEKINKIVISHRHFDHTGGLIDFPNAMIYIHKSEMKRKNNILGSLRGIKTVDIPENAKTISPNFENIPNPWGFKHVSNFLGDNSLLLVHTPGHVFGHISMVINADIPILLSGDAFYTSPSQYGKIEFKKIWDFLSVIYNFKKEGIILSSHDYINPIILKNKNLFEIYDPIGNAISSKDTNEYNIDNTVL